MHNIVYTVVFDRYAEHMPVCRNAASGKLSFIGGQFKDDELAYDAAYRILYETCGITDDDVILKPLFRISSKQTGDCIDVWFGRLHDDIGIVCANTELVWYSLNNDISTKAFDGDGLAEYIINCARKASTDATC